MKERIIVQRGDVNKIAHLMNCTRETVSHSLAFRMNSRLAHSIRKLAIARGGIKVSYNDKEETSNER